MLRDLFDALGEIHHHDDLESLLDFACRVVAVHAEWRTALITFYFGDEVIIGAVGVPAGTKERFLGSTRQTSAERRERKRRDLLRFRRAGTNVCFIPAGEGPRPASAYFPSPESLGTWHPDDRLLVFMHDWEDRILGTLSLDNPLSGNRPDEEAFARLADVDRFMNVVARIAENRFWSLRLKESEEAFRGVFESAADALFVLERDGRFVEVNPAASRLYGYSRAEFLRMTPRDLVPPSEQHKVDLFLERAGAGEEVHLEARELRKDGSAVVVEVRGVAFQHLGHPRLLAIVRDVTERNRLTERLLLRQKEESVVAVAGGVAHDFNNLLMGFTGTLDLLRREIPRDSPSAHHVARMAATSEKLAHLTGQLLAIAQGVQSEPSPLSIRALVAENLPVLHGLAESRCRLEVEASDDLWTVHADRVQIGQILLNLVQNACEAADRDGRVRIRAANVSIPAPWHCARTGSHPAGDYVKLVVEDDGPGMDAGTRSQVFDPYYSTRERGSGLGLPAVLGIVRRHEGAITLSSEPGRGTRVEILLPRLGSAAAPPERAGVQSAATGEALRVLLVDDEPLVREVAEEMLRALGHEVTTVESGARALEVYRESGSGIDVVLLDVLMPGMTGIEACEELREIDPDVRVVLASGRAECLVREEAGSCDRPVRFLQKPYSLADLRRAIGS